jgi:hypothetical protein
LKYKKHCLRAGESFEASIAADAGPQPEGRSTKNTQISGQSIMEKHVCQCRMTGRMIHEEHTVSQQSQRNALADVGHNLMSWNETGSPIEDTNERIK